MSPAKMTGPQRSQVVVRCLLLLASFVVVGVIALLLFTVRGNGESAVIDSGGRVVISAQAGQTVYQANPTPVSVILVGLLAACVVSGASLAFRIVRRSPAPGVAGLVAGGLVGVVAILGMLTVGPYILPLAALLVVNGLPLTRLNSARATSLAA